MQSEALNMVRSGLKSRIDSLALHPSGIALPHMCDQIEAIRREAHRFGLEPLERLASTLGGALALHGVEPVIHSYLDLMRDAVDCEDCGPDASATYLAALSLRVVGHG